MIHLDANFLVTALKSGSVEQAKLEAWLNARESIGIWAIAWAEFRCGPLSKQDEIASEQMFPTIEPILGGDAETAARLFNDTGRRSRSLSDCIIAAVAIRCSARLATANVDDFKKLTQYGLTLA